MPNQTIEKITAAIQYLETHLMEKTDLDTVAEALHYSKYHLHRMFTNTVGMTIHEYVLRRRLTEAAKLLVFSDRPVLDIALGAGYESQQAFTKIFTAMYKQPPSRYRENEKFYPLPLKFELEGSYHMLDSYENASEKITFAQDSDIPCWIGTCAAGHRRFSASQGKGLLTGVETKHCRQTGPYPEGPRNRHRHPAFFQGDRKHRLYGHPSFIQEKRHSQSVSG